MYEFEVIPNREVCETSLYLCSRIDVDVRVCAVLCVVQMRLRKCLV